MILKKIGNSRLMTNGILEKIKSFAFLSLSLKGALNNLVIRMKEVEWAGFKTEGTNVPRTHALKVTSINQRISYNYMLFISLKSLQILFTP